MEVERAQMLVRERRKQAGIVPYVKQIDTLALISCADQLLYLTYSAVAHDLRYENDKRSVVVLRFRCVSHWFFGRVSTGVVCRRSIRFAKRGIVR